jgi:altronate dehydratase small subunit
MHPRAYQIHAQDNVATLLDDASPGPVGLLGAAGAGAAVEAIEPVARAHKIALAHLRPGEVVTKYGVPIGRAIQPIARGAWVHLHNLASALDERSSSLDVHTGAPTDTAAAYV